MEVDRSDEDEEEDTQAQEDTEATQDEAGPVSDSDWLRSKTSRLLGLLDEGEQAEFDQQKAAAPAESQSPDVEESRTATFDDTIPQFETDVAAVEDEDEDAIETTPERPDPNVDLIRGSARLFLRNLAYDTTDADLQPLFTPFGKLDEVSFVLFSFISSSPPIMLPCAFAHALAECSYDEHPDRDSLCKSK